MNMNTPRIALQTAIDIVGGQTAMARALEVSQGQVWCWLHRDKRGAPADRAVAIERLTKGQVTRQQLRPDIFGQDEAA